jgi:hypothetical protein
LRKSASRRYERHPPSVAFWRSSACSAQHGRVRSSGRRCCGRLDAEELGDIDAQVGAADGDGQLAGGAGLRPLAAALEAIGVVGQAGRDGPVKLLDADAMNWILRVAGFPDRGSRGNR